MTADSPDTATRLERIHAWIGVWLGVVLAFHAWEGWAALYGREAHAARVSATSLRGAGLVASIVLVLLPLAAHAAIGIHLAARPRGTDSGRYASRGVRHLHVAAGVTTLGFLIFHVGHAWVPGLGPGAAMLAYEALWVDLGKPLVLGVYLLGVTATLFHLSQGLAAAATTLGVARTPGAARSARMVSIVAAIVLWFFFLNILTHFARGEALLLAPATPPAAPAASPSPGAE